LLECYIYPSQLPPLSIILSGELVIWLHLVLRSAKCSWNRDELGAIPLSHKNLKNVYIMDYKIYGHISVIPTNPNSMTRRLWLTEI